MAINVYYTQKGNKLTLSTDTINDFDSLSSFLLWAEKLGTRPDEDVVPLRVIKSLPLQNQIIIASDFLFTKMPRLSWAYGGSVIGMLQDNGFVLILVPKEKIKSSWATLASFFNIYSLRALQEQQTTKSEERNALLQQTKQQNKNPSLQETNREASIDVARHQANEHLEGLMYSDGQTKLETHRENIGKFKPTPNK